jgi:hypothetical protein
MLWICVLGSENDAAGGWRCLQALTHPVDVVKKRYQVSGLQRSLMYGKRIDNDMTASLSKCIHLIWRHEGASGFYKGMNASLLKVRRCFRQ